MNAILIISGAIIAIAGRHSVAGLIIGCGLMLTGWIMAERREANER